MKKIFGVILLLVLVVCIGGVKFLIKNHRVNEAIESLTDVYELEQAHRAMFGVYTDNIYAIIFIQDTLVINGGKAYYRVILEDATDTTFRASAISVVDFDGDSQFNKWVVNETGKIEEIIQD